MRFVVNTADTERFICVQFLTRTTTFEEVQNEANLHAKHQRNSLTFWGDSLRALSRSFTFKGGGENIVMKLPIFSLKSLEK